MPSAIRHVTVHCRDPWALAGFWAEVLDGRRQDDDAPGDPSVLVTHAGPPVLFEQATEVRPGPGRWHLDLQPDTTRAAEVARLLELGATLLHERTRPDGSGWVVLADPEGNELCVERSAAEQSAGA